MLDCILQLESLDQNMVRIHLTNGQFASKHGQAFLKGFVKEFVLVEQIHTVKIYITTGHLASKHVQKFPWDLS